MNEKHVTAITITFPKVIQVKRPNENPLNFKAAAGDSGEKSKREQFISHS